VSTGTAVGAISGFDHVQIAAPPGSEDDARKFFGSILGLPELPKPPGFEQRGGVWFECGTGQLHVGIEDDFRPSRKAHPAFRVRELDVVRGLFEQAGIEPRHDDAMPGIRRFYVDDPFGNRLEFTEDQR
jgi:catechol 2,3-dioxygenase-like lactoylglutathione lyase family enzyme